MALDPLLTFSDPALCVRSMAHEALLGGMIRGDGIEGFRPGKVIAPSAFRAAFGKVAVVKHEGYWTVSMPVRGTWLGLPLARVVHTLPEGGDGGDVYWVFRALPGQVEPALRAANFPARLGQEVALGPPDGIQPMIALRVDPADVAQTLFGCVYR